MSNTGAGAGQGTSRGRGRGRVRGRGQTGPSHSSQSGHFQAQPAGQSSQASVHARGRGFDTRGVSRAGIAACGQPRGRGHPGGTIFMPDRPALVDARIKDGSDVAVVDQLDRSNSGAEHQGLPLRPDFGSLGKEIALRANYFPVDVRGHIFRYSAEIGLSNSKDDKTLPRHVKQRVFWLAEQSKDWQQAGMPGRVAHDNAEKLVASIQLPQPLTIRGVYYNEGTDGPPAKGGTEYVLTFTFQEQVDQEILNRCLAGTPVDSQALAKVLSALNLVLTAHPSRTGVKIGRDDDPKKKKHPDQRLFFENPEPKDIGGGLAVRKGFYVSVRPAHKQLMVNVNTCHAAFYKPQSFLQAVHEYSQFFRGPIGSFSAFGRQVRVSTRPDNRVVMIKGISKWNALEHSFSQKESGSVVEYYERKHQITLVHPRELLLEGANRNFYPPEVCNIIPDQGFKGELADKRHAKSMLDVACKQPKENAEEIVNRGVHMLGFRDSNPLLDAFGIHVDTKMTVVTGRILDKPGLSYSLNAPAGINDRASWNLANVKFAVGARLDRWAVLVIQDSGETDFQDSKDPELHRIVNGIRDMCNKSGMRMGALNLNACAHVRLPRERKENRFRDDAIRLIKQTLVTLVDQASPELVLVMLSNDDRVVYNGLKRFCDVELDIATVCMQSSNVKKAAGRMQYYANVALKVNMKMGGINHTLDVNSGTWLKTASTMIMGVDVTHPTGADAKEGAPSVVAVVASVDQHFAQYPATLAIRESRIEIERREDKVLRDMFISRFELYKARNGALPERVILYRDGVSESQYVQVRDHELMEMRKAFQHFDSYQPKLSMVICGKRHHTRFYPTRGADATSDGNPLPGTVVDRGVTPAYEFDFFLQAHGGIKGTTRPTHYFVVHDENGFTADTLQQATYDLSYMFARATKAVSLVSPAYWADIACERGRCYLHTMTGANDAGTATGGKDKGKKGKKGTKDLTVFEKAVEMWGNGVSGPRLKDTMFYL